MKKYLLIFLVCLATPTIATAKCTKKEQIETLALNIYHEARGETRAGQQMVGEVTLNRVSSDSYPDDVCSVVHAKSQFAWVNDGKSDTPRETEQWENAVELAEKLINDDIEKFDNGATHFLNPNVVSRMPRWTRHFPVVARIGQHVFYKGT